MATTYTLIAAVTVGTAQSSIDFTSIPNTYTDLVVLHSTRCTTPGLYGGGYQQGLFVRFNSSTTSYSNRWIQAEGGTGVNSGTDYFGSGTTYGVLGGTVPSDWTASTFGNGSLYIPNYTGSQNKSFSSDTVGENNGSYGTLAFNAGLWSNSSAITSISISMASGNIATNSTAYLYGVKNA